MKTHNLGTNVSLLLANRGFRSSELICYSVRKAKDADFYMNARSGAEVNFDCLLF